VGTAAALILLVSKYGFTDVLQDNLVVVGPSRVAAQIVSGIGFLGAGIIIFRRGSVHGLTTAAAVWESAAIGMAARAGLLLLAITVTAMHFLIVLGFMPFARRLTARLSGSIRMHITYADGAGVMSRLLQACERRQWQLTELASDAPGEPLGAAAGQSGVKLTLSGRGIIDAPTVLAAIEASPRFGSSTRTPTWTSAARRSGGPTPRPRGARFAAMPPLRVRRGSRRRRTANARASPTRSRSC
jgi:putative Mg2+ transporter-C (MgtC) family protein